MVQFEDDIDQSSLEDFSWMRSRHLSNRKAALDALTLEEVIVLLEQAVEVYTVLAPTLPTSLLEQASEELELLTHLCRELSSRNL
jgi:hypothetical protein